MDAKRVFNADDLSEDELKALREAGIKGTVRLKGFEATFRALEGRVTTVKLTSGAVWIMVKGQNSDYVLFTEQADRKLSDGSHPWELASGKVNPETDADIIQTIIREAREETGLELTNGLPIALALKRKEDANVELPGIIVPTFNNELWINEPFLWSVQEPVGGLIMASMVTLETFFNYPNPMLYPDGSLVFAPPSGVDQSEISRLVLVPLDDVMDGSSKYLHATSHAWAQADAFKAFVLKMESWNKH